MESALEVDGAVQTFLRIKNGDEYTITKVIDDDVYRCLLYTSDAADE